MHFYSEHEETLPPEINQMLDEMMEAYEWQDEIMIDTALCQIVGYNPLSDYNEEDEEEYG